MKNLLRLALAIALVLGIGPQAWADFSIDQAPTEVPLWPAGPGDPGDMVLPGLAPMVDDGDGVPGAALTLAVPGLLPGTAYDTDGISFAVPNDPFAPAAGAPPGVLFSIDDGDIGPGLGPPDNAIELFYSPLPPVGASTPTKATEALLGLLGDPPPIGLDDDVDAYEDRMIPGPPGAYFSPDFDAPAGLDPGDIFFSPLTGGPPVLACNDVAMGITPGDPLPAVDVDAVHLVPNYVCAGMFPPGGPLCFLFSVDGINPPPPLGTDPGDIFITDCLNGSLLYLDDVTQLGIAPNEATFVDIDAISVPDVAPGVCEFDGDGFFDIACGGTDCDDLDPNVFPGAPEICDAKDSDCDLVLPLNEADQDADQYVQCTPYVGNVPGILGGNDCNDSNPNIYPNNANANCDCVAPIPQGTTEVCTDGQDNDCDGAIDAADPECGGGTCAGSAAASVQGPDGAREGGVLNMLAFLLIPVAAALGIVVVRRRR
jgi:hypothetical protein